MRLSFSSLSSSFSLYVSTYVCLSSFVSVNILVLNVISREREVCETFFSLVVFSLTLALSVCFVSCERSPSLCCSFLLFLSLPPLRPTTLFFSLFPLSMPLLDPSSIQWIFKTNLITSNPSRSLSIHQNVLLGSLHLTLSLSLVS